MTMLTSWGLFSGKQHSQLNGKTTQHTCWFTKQDNHINTFTNIAHMLVDTNTSSSFTSNYHSSEIDKIRSACNAGSMRSPSNTLNLDGWSNYKVFLLAAAIRRFYEWICKHGDDKSQIVAVFSSHYESLTGESLDLFLFWLQFLAFRVELMLPSVRMWWQENSHYDHL